MSERIQEAIKDFEHFKEMGYGHCDLPSSGNIEIALESMRERQERENPQPRHGTIFIGYQGVGKSTVANRNVEYIDLESGNFWVNGKRGDNWHEIYCNIAEHLCQQGKNVFVSSHAVVRERLRESGCDVCVIYPAPHMRAEWIRRLKDRYAETSTEKDYKAWKNAEEKYDENIADLMNESSFGHIVIESTPYNLLAMLEAYAIATEPKGEAKT